MFSFILPSFTGKNLQNFSILRNMTQAETKYTKLSLLSVLLLSFQDLRLTSAITAIKQVASDNNKQKKPYLFECFTSSSSSSRGLFWSYYRPVPKHSHCPRLALTTDRRVSGHKNVLFHSLLQSFRCYCNVHNKSNLVDSKIISQEKEKKTNQKHLARLKKKSRIQRATVRQPQASQLDHLIIFLLF